MVSFSELRDADPGVFDDMASKWSRLASELDSTSGDIKRTLGGLDGWNGDAANAAREHFGDVRAGYDTAAECIEKIPPVLRDLSDAISDAQEKVNGAMETVDSTYILRVDQATGQVRAGFGGPGDSRSDEERANDEALARELSEVITGALSDVNDADQEASRKLAELMPEEAGLELDAVGDGNVVRPSDIPGDNKTPEDVKQWWDQLTPMEQESAIYTHGDRIGGMDGIPVEARDRANRIRFAQEMADLNARHAELDELGDNRDSDQNREFKRLQDTLRGVNAIDERLEREPSATTRQAYLLDFDTEGTGRGIVATGNPDTADNVVTSVPGTGSNLAGIGGELDRGDQILAQANRYSADETSAVTWVGYDAPQDLGQATNSHYAENAAGDLRSFQDGLRATHEGGGSHSTVIGHSYGSTVVGHSAQDAELDVDNVVFIASPGVGVDNASELKVPEGTDIYASTAENDIIRGIPPIIHGRQPIDEDFGATPFTSDPGTEGSWYTDGMSTEAHSQYWNKDSASLKNMARIVVGEKPS
ncbi:MAG: alpha/beta hydrolase [Haloechinothrix sp.]